MKINFAVCLTSILLLYGQLFAQQKIYVCTHFGNIYTCNISNCSTQLLGPSGTELVDIAVTPNGRLWGIGPSSGDYLYNVDTTSGAASFVGVMGFSGNTLVELNDSILLMAGGTNLYRVNVNTGVGTFIGVTGYSAGGDLTWYDNDLYLVVEHTGLIIKIVLNTNATSIISVTASSVNPILPLCFGAITYPFPSEINSFIAFKVRNVYKICPFDTIPQLLCDSIISSPDIFYGAASHRLPVQNPLPVSCNSINGINELSPLLEFGIYPNPASNKVEIQNAEFKINEIMIFDLTGKKLYKSSNNLKSQIELDVTGLNYGIYILQIKTADFMQSKKLVIAR